MLLLLICLGTPEEFFGSLNTAFQTQEPSIHLDTHTHSSNTQKKPTYQVRNDKSDIVPGLKELGVHTASWVKFRAATGIRARGSW